MSKISEPIVFFGSGPVAADSLKLLSEWADIEAVITKPRPNHHRGSFPVIDACQGPNSPTATVLTVSSKKELTELFEQRQFKSRLGIVIDFGIIIAQEVIDAFPLGIVNSHFSLLPALRGADPITFSILSGQDQTGISLMLIDAKMDEGPLLAQAPYDLPRRITTPELTDALVDLSDATLRSILPEYLAGSIDPAPQTEVTMASSSEPSYSRKLTKADSQLDWHKPANQLEREIRAFIEWPKTKTTLAGKEVVVTEATATDDSLAPGEVKRDGRQLLVGCKEGSLRIERLKPAGKQEMTAEAFLAGYGQSL